MWQSLCWCPESQQDSQGGGGVWGDYSAKKWFYLDEPPLLCCDRRDTEQLQRFGCFLFHLWIRCKQVHPFQESQQPVRWTEQDVKLNQKKKKKKFIQNLAAGPGGETLLAGWDEIRAGQGFNCGVGCTFHSALFQAGSWMCSGGRTTWQRRRRGLRGPPSPHTPGSWRAVRQRYLEAPETDFIFSSLT